MIRAALSALCVTLLFPATANATAPPPRLAVEALPGVTVESVKKAQEPVRVARFTVPARKTHQQLDLWCRGGKAPTCALTPKNSFGHLIGPNRWSDAVAESVKVGFGGFGIEVTWGSVTVETPIITVTVGSDGGGGGDTDDGGDKHDGDGGGEDESSDQ
ncbi:MAG: hypothetical protein EP329_10770 [Deltaproteobacteria bacterium]|nr:MAG: hypothetical protein EP329_10770 [Deltaproteobacteria bacterium]